MGHKHVTASLEPQGWRTPDTSDVLREFANGQRSTLEMLDKIERELIDVVAATQSFHARCCAFRALAYVETLQNSAKANGQTS